MAASKTTLEGNKVRGAEGFIGTLHAEGMVVDSTGTVVGLRKADGSIVSTTIAGLPFDRVVSSRSTVEGTKVVKADGHPIGHLQADGVTVVGGDGNVIGVRRKDGAVVRDSKASADALGRLQASPVPSPVPSPLPSLASSGAPDQNADTERPRRARETVERLWRAILTDHPALLDLLRPGQEKRLRQARLDHPKVDHFFRKLGPPPPTMVKKFVYRGVATHSQTELEALLRKLDREPKHVPI